MWNDIWQKIKDIFSSVLAFIRKNVIKITYITGLTAIIVLLQKLGLWLWILGWIGVASSVFGNFVTYSWNAPVWVWLALLLVILILIFFTVKNSWYIGKVAGEFYDDFQGGLSKWDYGNAEWKIEDEEGKKQLSIQGHDSEGFTKKGFSWSDYEFSFETKIISVASGWIIRANGDNFFMVQLYLGDAVPKLRPHYHVREGSTIIWHPDEPKSVDLSKLQLKNKIGLLQWIKVKIIVEGNQVDIYLDGVHALHYIMNKIGTIIERPFTFVNKEDNKEYQGTVKEAVIMGSYNAGRVGFRTASNEHAHFRNVKVKPL